MPMLRSIPWDIYEEHLDEAAFLWGQWQRAMDAANYTVDEVIDGPEERLLAHLDGLVLAGKPAADRLLIPALTDDDPGKIFAAAWVLLQAEDADHLDLVFEALTNAEKEEGRAAIGRAFELSHRTDLCVRLLPLFEKSAPGVQAVIVNVVAASAPLPEPRRLGNSELPLEALLATDNSELLMAALRALRRAPDPALAHFVERSLASSNVAIRNTAIETAIVLRIPTAWDACRKLVADNAPSAKLPLALLALGGEPADVEAVIKTLEVETMRRDALWALGFAGTVEAAEAALTLIDDETFGSTAGESFATITGLLLTGAFVIAVSSDNAPPPEDAEKNADGFHLDVRPQHDLSVPNPERVRSWWKKTSSRFLAGVRYLSGQLLTSETLRIAIAAGPMWRRPVWCMYVATLDLQIWSWARRQRDALLPS